MKNKICIFALIMIMMFALTGCGEQNNNNNGAQTVSTNIVRIANGGLGFDSYDGYYYLIDKNTDVVYLEYDGYYRHCITLMVNADGTPVTAEQLGINY